MIPILMITHNRLEYTKKALKALLRCNVFVYVFDNGSEDGTKEWLRQQHGADGNHRLIQLTFSKTNRGIAYAMNCFMPIVNQFEIVGKVDNDTIVPSDFIEKMLPHMEHADLVQAKHRLIAASKVGTFDEWVSKMPNITPTLKQNHFIGGSGILFKRQLVNHIPETEDKLQGWRQFQRDHPELKKAFALDCEIELLDEHGYEDYPEYYKMTGRVD